MKMSPEALAFEHLVSGWRHCSGTLGRRGLVGGSPSLEAGFESLKALTMAISLLLPLRSRCELAASSSKPMPLLCHEHSHLSGIINPNSLSFIRCFGYGVLS